MDRRSFLFVFSLGGLSAPLAADAQPTGKVYRIGYLGMGSATVSPPFVEAFREGLRELGLVEGQNIVIDYRFAEGRFDRLPELAAELVLLRVDVIMAGPTPPAMAAKNATGTIPIVMAGVGDPVEQGLIASLARPGGNITGVSFSVGMDIFGKDLELLREAVPKARRVAILSNPANPSHALAITNVKAAAGSSGAHIAAILDNRGTISLSSSSRLPATSGPRRLRPVMLPPGCARLAAKPRPTGLVLIATMGMAVVL